MFSKNEEIENDVRFIKNKQKAKDCLYGFTVLLDKDGKPLLDETVLKGEE